MKAPTSIFLLAVVAANAQLTVTRVHEVARHPYELMPMKTSDLDGDGDSDLVLHGSGNRLTTWCENRGDGTFARPAVIELAPRVLNYDPPFPADLEDDGTVDLYSPSGTRARSLGGGDFSPPEAVPGGTWPTPPPPDTFPSFRYPIDDIVLTLPGGPSDKDRLLVRSAGPNPEESALRIYSLDANGQAVVAPLMAGGVELIEPYPRWDDYNLALLDAEGDGDMDLIFWYNFSIYRNRGDGTFDAAAEIGDIDSLDFTPTAHTAVRIPGEILPALVTRESYYVDPDGDGEPNAYLDRLSLRLQTESGGQLLYQPESVQFRLDFGGDFPAEIIAVPAANPADGDEIWVRRMAGVPAPAPRDRLQGYRFLPGTGWVLHADLEIPGRGWGELHSLSLTPGGPPGIAIRLGGLPSVSGDREDKVIWASLASLRSGNPAWQTLAGPFNSFQDFRIADLDQDGKPDLVSGDGDHGLGGGKSGRIHFIHDLAGERVHQVIDTEETDRFGGASPLPGNRVVIGDANGDLLPDLSVSSGFGGAIRLLENLGNRQFAPPADRVASDDILRPLRLDATRHRFFDGSRVFTQAPAAGAPATLLYDQGIAGEVVFTDLDGDGDDDVVAAPCPLGNVTGWGKTGPAGTVVSWHFLSSAQASEIRDDSGIAGIGWIDAGPVFKRVRDGAPGVTATPLPALPGSFLWPPVDLDSDGDFDLLALQRVPPEEDFGISPIPLDLVWHENRGTSWQLHPERLFRPWYAPASLGLAVVQPLAPGSGSARVLFGNSTGEVFQLDFTAPVPGGPFGAWLASFQLSGAAAGAESDPDGDGLTNLEEALQGSSPVVATPGGFAIPTALSPPDGWTFSSALNLAGSGITVVAQTSGDLAEWTDLPGEPVLSAESGGRWHYRTADPAMAGETKRFVRFRFAWEP